MWFIKHSSCIYVCYRLFSLLGYEKDDLIGKKPFDLFHHDDIQAIVKCRNKGECEKLVALTTRTYLFDDPYRMLRLIDAD